MEKKVFTTNNLINDICNLCSKHNISVFDYCVDNENVSSISFEYNNVTRSLINSFLNEIYKMEGVEILFSSSGVSVKDFKVTILVEEKYSNIVFSIVKECLEQNILDDSLNDDLGICLNVAIDMNYNLYQCDVKHFNDVGKSNYMVSLYKSGDIYLLFKSHCDSYKIDNGVTYCLYNDIESFNEACKKYESICSLSIGDSSSIGFLITTDTLVNKKIDFLFESIGAIEKYNEEQCKRRK